MVLKHSYYESLKSIDSFSVEEFQDVFSFDNHPYHPLLTSIQDEELILSEYYNPIMFYHLLIVFQQKSIFAVQVGFLLCPGS